MMRDWEDYHEPKGDRPPSGRKHSIACVSRKDRHSAQVHILVDFKLRQEKSSREMREGRGYCIIGYQLLLAYCLRGSKSLS